MGVQHTLLTTLGSFLNIQSQLALPLSLPHSQMASNLMTKVMKADSKTGDKTLARTIKTRARGTIGLTTGWQRTKNTRPSTQTRQKLS